MKTINNIYFTLFFCTFILSCSPKKYSTLQSYDATLVSINDSISEDRNMSLFIADYKIGLDTMMQKIVGITEYPLTKAQPESTLGNLMANAQLYAIRKMDTFTNISIVNQGGIRISFLPPGEISIGNIFEMMPFDNTLVVVYVPKDTLIKFCDHIAQRGGWPVSGISFQINQKKAENILVNGKPLKENYVYKIVTSDYIANGGDDCTFLRTCKRDKYNIFLRDAIIDYISSYTQSGETLKLKLENRIYYAE